MPAPGPKLRDAGLITFYWLLTYFALFVGLIIILSKADCLSKPERQEIRKISLRQPKTIKELQQEEDSVYCTLRDINQAVTFRLSLNSPIASLLCLGVTLITVFFLSVSFVVSLST